MSRIGKKIITIPEKVEVEIKKDKIVAKAGEKVLELVVPAEIEVKVSDNQIRVEKKANSNKAEALHGLTARLISNMLFGLNEKFTKELTFTGTGYRASVNGKEVILNMGYSHEIKIAIPENIEVQIKKNDISITGIEKEKVGALASKIRDVRPPEVYKGKGIRYKSEIIKRKAGKKTAAA